MVEKLDSSRIPYYGFANNDNLFYNFIRTINIFVIVLFDFYFLMVAISPIQPVTTYKDITVLEISPKLSAISKSMLK